MKESLLHHVRHLPDAQLPSYIYDLPSLRQHTRSIRATLPRRVELLYAVKANPDPHLLQALAEQVDGFEVASGGELRHVRALLPDAAIVFGGPGKTSTDLDEALSAGVERLHVDSEQELRLLTSVMGHRTSDILLRVNAPVVMRQTALTMGGGPSPFGLDPSQLDRCLRIIADDERIRLQGLHVHLASGLDARAHLALVDEVVSWADCWRRQRGTELTEINVGGGMGVDYDRPHKTFDWSAFGTGLQQILARHPGLTLKIEPGRSVTAYCGTYVTRVLDVKFSRGEAFAVLRGGTHHLRTPAAKQHDQPFEIIPDDAWHLPWIRPEVRDEPVTLVGQLCTPKDVLARQVMINRLRVGDRIAFAMAGAYAWNISHQGFLMHPHPTFHHHDEGDRPVPYKCVCRTA